MLFLAVWPALIAGAASLAGGLIGNRAARKESKRNRRFQENMRSTAWQAGVADMEKAGLNPALAYSQGPAATPGGSMATQDDVISPAVSSAMQAKRLKADLNLVNQQARKAKEETRGAKVAADSATARLMSYGVKYSPTGRLMLDMPSGELPRMTKEIQAAISLNEARARREQITSTTMQPVADLAKMLGIYMPLLGGAATMGPNILKGFGSIRKAPIKILRRKRP